MSPQLLLFPRRAPRTTLPAKPRAATPSAQIIALPPAPALRQCVFDAPQDGKAGRMVLSGRIDAVCAALDQMVANG